MAQRAMMVIRGKALEGCPAIVYLENDANQPELQMRDQKQLNYVTLWDNNHLQPEAAAD